MIRAVKMSWMWYVVEIASVEEDLENIETFADEGSPVLLCHDLEEAKEILGTDDIEMVE